MALYPHNNLSTKQIEELKRRIEKEFGATNVSFIEQTYSSCIFQAFIDGKKLNFSYDKQIGVFIEDEGNI